MERLISLAGLFVMIGLAWLMSSNKRKVSLRIIVGGLLLQFALALILLRDPFADYFFSGVDTFFAAMLGCVESGAGFLFRINPSSGDPALPPKITLLRTFACGVLPTIIFFSSLIAMFNVLIGWVGSQFGFVTTDGQYLWSLEGALGYLFAPLAWLMGIESADCLKAGQLLGLKMAANEFIAYHQMGQWIGDGSPVEISWRTQHIMTYALSGFSNFGAIGIQIGGIGGLVPQRRSDLARLGLRAMIGGTLACCMTACIAGALI